MSLQVIVDRSNWLRGEGPSVSYLLRPADGKMCCLGFAALAAGATEKEITGQHSIGNLMEMGLCPEALSDGKRDDSTFDDLYHTNDSQVLSDAERERDLLEYGWELGIHFTFVDALSPPPEVKA